jgi:hypothetical protein
VATINCCKDCPKKHPGCHSDCADYIIEKVFHEAEKAERYEKMLIQRRLDDQMIHGLSKYKKYIGKDK